LIKLLFRLVIVFCVEVFDGVVRHNFGISLGKDSGGPPSGDKSQSSRIIILKVLKGRSSPDLSTVLAKLWLSTSCSRI